MIKFPNAAPSSTIINNLANDTQHHYLAGLSVNKTSAATCSAALVAPTWLLTLADCVQDSQWAAIGSKCASGDKVAERIEIVRRVIDLNYTTSKDAHHKFAMLELKTASKYPPVNISWSDNWSDNTTVWVRGFDTTTYNKSLVETTAQLWGYTECDKFYCDHHEYGRTIHESMQCLRGSSCEQGHGSAVMVDSNGSSQLIGLLHWQSRNMSIAPAVFLRIKAAQTFIQSVLKSPTPSTTPTPTTTIAPYTLPPVASTIDPFWTPQPTSTDATTPLPSTEPSTTIANFPTPISSTPQPSETPTLSSTPEATTSSIAPTTTTEPSTSSPPITIEPSQPPSLTTQPVGTPTPPYTTTVKSPSPTKHYVRIRHSGGTTNAPDEGLLF